MNRTVSVILDQQHSTDPVPTSCRLHSLVAQSVFAGQGRLGKLSPRGLVLRIEGYRGSLAYPSRV